MKYLLIALGLMYGICFSTCKPSISTNKNKKTLTIDGVLSKCHLDSVRFFTFNGINLSEQFSVPVLTNEKGEKIFQIKTSMPQEGFYYIGESMRNRMKLLIGKEQLIRVKADCRVFTQGEIITSNANKQYKGLTQTLNGFDRRYKTLAIQHSQAINQGNIPNAKKLMEEIKTFDKEKVSLLDSMRQVNPLLGKVTASRLYVSHHSNPKYSEELSYYLNEYFQFTNLRDSTLHRLPEYYESLKRYTQTLSRIPIEFKQKANALDGYLSYIQSKDARHTTLAGYTVGFMQGNYGEGFIKYAQLYLKEYPDRNPPVAKLFKDKLSVMLRTQTGAEAPDIHQITPEGDHLRLSDLRGKVILVDFWASWCGPCRKANPELVRIYEKYRGQGFDIYGVSLDNKRDSWLKAIEKDKLRWHHVSDLKGWKSEAAGQYGVTSIPQTFLLDEEGKIIARNLKGAALEQTLKQHLVKN